METMHEGTTGTSFNDPTVNDYDKLVRYCALGFELRILDEDAIIRRVDSFCKEKALNERLKTDIIRAIISKVYRVEQLPIRSLFSLIEECDTSQWSEDVDWVVCAEMTRRDRALGIKR